MDPSTNSRSIAGLLPALARRAAGARRIPPREGWLARLIGSLVLAVACGDEPAGQGSQPMGFSSDAAPGPEARPPADEPSSDPSAAPGGPAAVEGPAGPALDGPREEAPGEEASERGSPLVVIDAGALRGASAGGVDRFLAIPYAAPPLGPLRLAPPVPPEPWEQERDATQAGPTCLQPAAVVGGIGGDEDCLTLNVHRPVGRSAADSLPVMVWIHGGSFRSGAGSIYDPRRLVTQNDIVVVTVNYRLGALGFLAAPALSSESPEGLSGDYGLMDQLAALRWVRENIAAFGGDPERVTVAGQSAGGASVCALLASPRAEGLVAGAIIQSGSCASGLLEAAESQGTLLAEALGCTDEASVGSCLREIPAAQLVAAGANAVFGPVVGGGLLPSPPARVVLEGQQLPVPVLVGGVRDEMKGFAISEFPLEPDSYRESLAIYLPGRSVDEIVERYPLGAYPDAYAAFSAVLSDSGWYFGSLGGCVTSALAGMLSASTATYAYELEDLEYVWSTSLSPTPLPRGASHSSDLSFLFDTVGVQLNEPFGAAQQALADQMVAAWGAFVRSADPSVPGAEAWPQYDVESRRVLRLEPNAVRVVTDFQERHHCDFWQTPPPAQPSDADAP